jgi:hypothetical protein
MSVATGGLAKVPLPTGDALSSLGLLWVAYLGSDEDEDDEESAPQSTLASSKGVVSGSFRGTTDVP